MPSFTYTGSAGRLVLGGRALARGIPTELTGRAAEAAAAHPDVVEADEESAPADSPTNTPDGLGELIAFVEANDEVDPGELEAKLRALDTESLQALAGEYEIRATDADDAIAQLVNALLAEPEPEPLTGEALDKRAAELEIEGRSSMSADEKRASIAKAEAAAAGGS